MQARSSYFVVVSNTNLTSANILIYIHSGAQSAGVAGYQYSLSSDAIDEEVVFNIGPFVKDYIDSEFDGNYDSNAVWVNYQVTEYISGVAQTPSSVVQLEAYEGYTEFMDGAYGSSNPYTQKDIMISGNEVVAFDDEPFYIPVCQDNVVRATYMNRGVVVATHSISASTNSDSIIRYLSNSISDSFKDRVIADSGSLESEAEENYRNKFNLFRVDRIVVEKSDGSVEKINIVPVSECKYSPVKLVFLNKYGAYQDLWFFKVKKEAMTAESSEFRSLPVASGAYSTSKHVYKKYNANGRSLYTLNTGMYFESQNEAFRELVLSEKVWLVDDGAVIPVNLTTNSLNLLQSVNDKNVNYQIEVISSFDTVNRVG